MRYAEICEALRSITPYEYEYVGTTLKTQEFGDHGGVLKHPIEQTKYSFDSDNGLHYIVHCNLANHILEMSFTTIGGKIALNGAGDALRVLATVSHIVGTYCRADPPRAIEFTANQQEPSRVRLYDQMCKQAERYFPGYALEERKPFGRLIKYRMVRPLTQADTMRDIQDEADRAAKLAKDRTERAERQRETEARRQREEDERARTARLSDDFFNNLSDEDARLLGLLDA